MDVNDPELGFFHRWTAELARHFEEVTVICLSRGTVSLPGNVRVLSLGKESGQSRWKYLRNFFRYIFAERANYDAVFVHMNQEYVLLGGLFWKLWGKRIYMWRNHHQGTPLTGPAAALCTKVFCTSRYSYTARYKKTVFMPVGVDTATFRRDASVARTPRSILFLARITPVKKAHLLIEALRALRGRGVAFTASIYGNSLPKDRDYHDSLKRSVADAGLAGAITFHSGIPNTETVRVYNGHEVFVNLSSSGMYDKTIFEAAACESLVLASNDNLHGLIGEEYIFAQDAVGELAAKLEALLDLSLAEKESRGRALRTVALENHSLEKLGERLAEEMA